MIFKGHCPALVTPITADGKHVNYEEFKKLIDFQIENKAGALLFIGTTGEPTTLSAEEKAAIVKFAVEYVNGRVPVIAGAGSNSTEEAVAKSKLYKSMGVNALLQVTPYYNKCTQKGLIAHFTAIADSVNIPIILYNVPGRTGVNMQPKTVAELAKHKNIIGVKEASGNIEQISEIAKLVNKNFALYSGDDGITLPVMALGGLGVISVAGNVVPGKMAALCEACLVNDYVKARKLQLELLPLIKTLFCEVNPIPAKTAVTLMGYNAGPVRLPLTQMEEENKQKLITELKKLKLVK